MRLKYETGIATFIQFIVASFFVLVTQLGSSVATCVKDSQNCVSNLLPSIIFFLLIAIIFGFIWIVGFLAQDRRSHRLALLLIAVESPLFLIALYSVKLNIHSGNVLGIIGSLGMLAMSGWISLLAFRLMRAKGGRVVVQQRPRRRKRHTPPVDQ